MEHDEFKNNEKRLDLQRIRGLAILSVLGFHFFPEIFPNGYLGVDQFFVLSGFLMCMLLSKSEKTKQSTFELIKIFYIRRLRRILPLYYLTILLSLQFLYLFFPDTSIDTNEKSAKSALFFLSNRMKTNKESYFEMLSVAIDIFTHTWSLSVEIQFYFLAPFIFLLPFRNRSLVSLSIASFAYFHYLPKSLAFLNVFSRIWQFLVGMLAYLLSELPDKNYELVEDLEKSQLQEDLGTNKKLYLIEPNSKLSLALTFIVAFITFNHLIFPQDYIRPLLTFCTSSILLFSNGENNTLLSNKVLTYIGDISYSLYLIHWPIYAYWKITQKANLLTLCYSITFSILLAIVIYHFFEKWYTSLSNKTVAILITVLLLGNIKIMYYDSFIKLFHQNHQNLLDFSSLDGDTSNLTLEDAEKLNYDWSIHDWENLLFDKCNYEDTKPLGWCRINDLGNKSENAYKIMVIGNSWAANHAKLIYQECGNKAREMIIGSAFGCEPLYPSTQSDMCKQNVNHFQKHVEEYKPDYAIHITRDISYGEPFLTNVDLKNDPIYSYMLNQLRIMLKSIKKKLFILNAIPRTNPEEVGKIVKNIRNNISFEEIDKNLVSEDTSKRARRRYSQLVKDCGEKCELFDYLPKFYQNDTKNWRYFDDHGFSYFSSPNHLTFHGLKHVRDVIRGVCDKI